MIYAYMKTQHDAQGLIQQEVKPNAILILVSRHTSPSALLFEHAQTGSVFLVILHVCTQSAI